MPALPHITSLGRHARALTTRRATQIASLGTAASMICLVAAGAANPGSGGDPYLPDYGNAGFDIEHYDIDVEYHPGDVTVTGTTTVTAHATEKLPVFHLDLLQEASDVKVDGRPATFTREGKHELVITPATPIAKDAKFAVTVTYSGSLNPGDVDHPTAYYKYVGPTDDGGVLVLGQPYSAGYWYPSNDHPSDKATYDIAITAPKQFDGISNGVKQEETVTGAKKTTRWRENNPMATFLSFLSVGKYTYYSNWDPADPTVWVAVGSQGVDPETHQNAVDSVRLTSEIVRWGETHFGPYPFESRGAVVPSKNFPFSLENQGRPVFSPEWWQNGSSYSVVVNKVAHQWFGNSVSVENWQDIWLSEGLTTWIEWKYDEDHFDYTANDSFKNTYQRFGPKAPPAPEKPKIPTPENPKDPDIPEDPKATEVSSLHGASTVQDTSTIQDRAFWGVTLNDPTGRRIFSTTVYLRGAMTFQALRNRIGEDDYRELLREWASRYAYDNVSTADFTALAEEISGEDLTGFFEAWLNGTTRPAPTKENGIPDPSWGEPKVGVMSARDQEVLDRMYRTHARPATPID